MQNQQESKLPKADKFRVSWGTATGAYAVGQMVAFGNDERQCVLVAPDEETLLHFFERLNVRDLESVRD